jgi:hypothetical protein
MRDKEHERLEEKKTDLRDQRQRAWKILEMRDREEVADGLRMHLGLGLETIYTCFF